MRIPDLTIMIYLAGDGSYGMKTAWIKGFSSSILVSDKQNFDKFLTKKRLQGAGIYIFQGPDPEDPSKMKSYVGEANILRQRLPGSAEANLPFWETVAVAVLGDRGLNKAHALYLEAMLLQRAKAAQRHALQNDRFPDPCKMNLDRPDRSMLEQLLTHLEKLLPTVGFDLLKPMPQPAPQIKPETAPSSEAPAQPPQFELRHKSRIKAQAYEREGKFVVTQGSEALKGLGFTTNTYHELRGDLISQGVLAESAEAGGGYVFAKDWAFSSPSAAATIALGRQSNGRRDWRVIGSPQTTYAAWQEAQAKTKTAEDPQA